jgi:phage shock protein PspC (stress-responsive transcriptional regulator)
MSEGIYRSTNDRVLGGICGGLADKWDMNATALRIIVFVVTFFLGAWLIWIIVYIVLWAALPEPPTKARSTHQPPP